MSKTQKNREFDRIERLRDRRDYLRRGIETGFIKDPSYRSGELSALEWAIPLLEDHMMNKTIKSLPLEVREKFGFIDVPSVS